MNAHRYILQTKPSDSRTCLISKIENKQYVKSNTNQAPS